MSTDLQICSKALVYCGSPPITSFSASTLESVVANQLYSITRDGLFSKHEWRWCRVNYDLTATASGTPVADWDYHYALPSDCLRVISLGDDGDSDGLEYFVQGGKILTDKEPTVTLTYVSRFAESTWPTWFEMCVVMKLAEVFCVPLTQSASMKQLIGADAEKAYREAKRLDAEQNVNSYVAYPSAIAERI